MSAMRKRYRRPVPWRGRFRDRLSGVGRGPRGAGILTACCRSDSLLSSSFTGIRSPRRNHEPQAGASRRVRHARRLGDGVRDGVPRAQRLRDPHGRRVAGAGDQHRRPAHPARPGAGRRTARGQLPADPAGRRPLGHLRRPRALRPHGARVPRRRGARRRDLRGHRGTRPRGAARRPGPHRRGLLLPGGDRLRGRRPVRRGGRGHRLEPDHRRNSTEPVAFAREIFRLLGVYEGEVLDAWYRLFHDSDAAAYEVLEKATADR